MAPGARRGRGKPAAPGTEDLQAPSSHNAGEGPVSFRGTNARLAEAQYSVFSVQCSVFSTGGVVETRKKDGVKKW